MKFDFYSYHNGSSRVCMHCETEEEAEVFVTHLHRLGKSWCNGQSYIDNNNFHVYKSNTVYYFKDGHFASIGYAKGESDTILEFSDFDWGDSPEESYDCDINDFFS